MDNNNSIVTNEEIIDYLKITHAMLKVSKSTIDLDRLKYVIDILKKDKSKTYSANQKKVNYKVEDIIGIISKQKDGADISFEEDELIKNYRKERSYLDIVSSKNFSGLYSFLREKGSELASIDLIILYFYLTGQETKLKKKEDMLREIISYIGQNMYFDNMNNRFSGNIKNNVMD